MQQNPPIERKDEMVSKKFTQIDYEHLVQESLRNVIRTVLEQTEKHGLPGDHHFYISFATMHPDVDMPDYLKVEYPEEITIVLQHEFWDLVVEEERFSLTLCFNDMQERISIPFSAIVSFVDPSVKFGLQFTPTIHERLSTKKTKRIKADPTSTKKKTKDKSNKSSEPSLGSNVVTLDSFRKKK